VEIVVDSAADEIVEVAIEVDMAVVAIVMEVAEVAVAMAAMSTVVVGMEVVSRVMEVDHPTAIQPTAHKAEATMLRAPMEMALVHPMQPPPPPPLPSNNLPVLHSSRPTQSKRNVSTRHGAPTTLRILNSTLTPHMVAMPQSWHSTNSKQRWPAAKQVLPPPRPQRRHTLATAACQVKLARL
jgi:hypothetical protein